MLQRLFSQSPLLGGCWLLPDVRHAVLLVAAENGGRGFAAEIAVNAGFVHVERARDVERCFVVSISHDVLFVSTGESQESDVVKNSLDE